MGAEICQMMGPAVCGSFNMEEEASAEIAMEFGSVYDWSETPKDDSYGGRTITAVSSPSQSTTTGSPVQAISSLTALTTDGGELPSSTGDNVSTQDWPFLERRDAALIGGKVDENGSESSCCTDSTGRAASTDADDDALIDDPVLPTRCPDQRVSAWMEDCKKQGTTLWGDYLNSLGFRESSPIRPYITAVLENQLQLGLRQIFDKLDQKLTLTDLLDISGNIRGNVHVLNNMDSGTKLAELEEAEKTTMFKRIPRILPAKDLERFDVFQAWMELVIVRRVVKTLFYSISSKTWLQRIELLSNGLSINIVIDISLTIKGRDGEPFTFRVHSVTPRSSSDISRIEE